MGNNTGITERQELSSKSKNLNELEEINDPDMEIPSEPTDPILITTFKSNKTKYMGVYDTNANVSTLIS